MGKLHCVCSYKKFQCIQENFPPGSNSYRVQKLQGPQATWSNSYRVHKLQGPKATGSTSYMVQKLQGPQATGSKSYRVHKLHGPKATGSTSYRVLKLHGPKATGSKSYPWILNYFVKFILLLHEWMFFLFCCPTLGMFLSLFLIFVSLDW